MHFDAPDGRRCAAPDGDPMAYFRHLLGAQGLSQRKLAEEMPNGLGPDQSRISRAIHGKIRLSFDEKQRLIQTMLRLGCLSRIEDLLWLAGVLGMDEEDLVGVVPPPAVLTNLPLQNACSYIFPDTYLLVRQALTQNRNVDRLRQEVRDLEDLHRMRLLALVGPPGSGKTTFLRRLGADYAVRHRFDVILHADLAAEGRPVDVLGRWLDVFGERPAGLATAQAILRSKLDRKRTLLLLDNVVDAGALADLLAGGERTRAVVVRRQDVALEAGIPNGAIVAHGAWDGQAACRYLETQRGRELAAEERGWVYRINDLVDGLPLAWVVLALRLHDTQGWEDIIGRLESAPLGVLNWSHPRLRASLLLGYEGLPEPAREMFRALGVFAPDAPFSEEAVAFVLGVSRTDAQWRLDALRQAAFMMPSPTESYRQMHRLLHHLAGELVAGDGQREIYAKRLTHAYAVRTQPVREEQNGDSWPEAIHTLLLDLPNVRRGQAWAAERRHPLAMDYYLNASPYLVAIRDDEGRSAWGRAALPVAESYAEALTPLERLSFYGQLPAPDLEQRWAFLDKALAIARDEMGEDGVAYQVYALCWQARFLYRDAGRALNAEPILRQALALARSEDSSDLETHVLGEVVRFLLIIHDHAGLKAILSRLPADSPSMHAGGGSGAYYHNVRADALRATGHWQEASEAYGLVIGLRDAIADLQHGALLRLRRAVCRAHLGDKPGEQEDLAWVQERLESLPRWLCVRHCWALAEIALTQGDAKRAQDALGALPLGWEEELDIAVDVWLTWQRVYQALGHGAKAGTAEQHARAVARRRGFELYSDSGQDTERGAASAVPDLLEQVKGGRPPLF